MEMLNKDEVEELLRLSDFYCKSKVLDLYEKIQKLYFEQLERFNEIKTIGKKLKDELDFLDAIKKKLGY